MNDRADLCLAAQYDVSMSVRTISLPIRRGSSSVPLAGSEYQRTIPSSLPKLIKPPPTTSPSPIFATTSKANPDPVVGLEGLRRAGN